MPVIRITTNDGKTVLPCPSGMSFAEVASANARGPSRARAQGRWFSHAKTTARVCNRNSRTLLRVVRIRLLGISNWCHVGIPHITAGIPPTVKV